MAEVLAYFGVNRSQDQVKAVLRADGNPYGMAPYGVPAYARSMGLKSLLGIAGNELLIKLLVSQGFPVIVSQYVSLTDHVGHYRPIQAYDDHASLFISSDPYLGQNHAIAYVEFDAIWKSTNRRFMVLYTPKLQARLDSVLAAAGWNSRRAFSGDLARLRALIAHKGADATGYGSPRNYQLSIAWDELQLGDKVAARQALAAASQLGANATVTGWVAGEIARA